MYNELTHFNELMDSNIYRFETAISNIELRFNELKTAIEERIGDQVKADQELMEDIEGNTNEMETGESTPEGSETPVAPAAETDPSSTPAAEDQTPTSEEPTTPTDPQEPSKSPSDIADEVIQGKWGSGDERKKALEDAGYNSDEIQDIVNKKMNGTYTGDSTSGGNGGAPTPTDTPTGGDTTPTGGNTNPTSGGGQESPLSPGETPAPEPTSPTFRSEGNMGLVNAAKDYVGTPYVYGGTNKGGIDCSALVQNAARANGIELPRTTGELAKVGVQVSPNDIRPGDVLFTNGGKHVVIHMLVRLLKNHYLEVIYKQEDIGNIFFLFITKTYKKCYNRT